MKLIDWSMDRFKKFSVFDVAVFKIYLATIGLIVGAYISEFVKQYIWVFGAIFAVTMLWILNAMFFKK